jgi:23S rRNA pseudouridine2605 synthase
MTKAIKTTKTTKAPKAPAAAKATKTVKAPKSAKPSATAKKTAAVKTAAPKKAAAPRKSAKAKLDAATEAVVPVTEVPAIDAEVPSQVDAEPEVTPAEPIELTSEDEFDEDADEASDEDEEDTDEASDDEDEDEDDSEDDDSVDEDDEEESDNDEETGDEGDEDSSDDEDEDGPEASSKPRPPAKLERLQKILAKSGVASRRKAEEMMEQGRVQVNGKVITALGTKADLGRDHIRVDGKLLGGAERLRYFVLNKPKGFVTTVKDPEGRPTVMQFFDKMKERLYPVGRLDYMSEGLLVVTNDGDLANRLTKAASGVEKTYLVKVAGQPTEDELDVLRGGVAIERGKPGSAKVRTSPARIRQVRQGDNPWYEVVLIEGRNRELRKMFEEVGHFVEKIRRVGYGPLVLDQEPGNMRELRVDELDQLRLAAEGKLRTPKSKDLRRRNALDAAGVLPTVTPLPSSARSTSNYSERTGSGYRPAAGRSDARPRRTGTSGPSKFGSARPDARPSARPAWQKDDRPARPYVRPEASPAGGAAGESSPSASKPYSDRPSAPRTYGDRPTGGRTYGGKPAGARSYGDRPSAGRTFGDKPVGRRPYGDKPERRPMGDKPTGGRTFGDRPAGRTFGDRPTAPRTYGDKPARPFGDKPAGRSFGDKPAWNKSGPSDRPAYKRPTSRRPEPEPEEELGPRRPSNLTIEPISGPDRASSSRSNSIRSSSSRPGAPRPYAARPSAPRSSSDRPSAPRSYSDRPRPTGDRPRPTGDRPFTPRPSSPRPPRPEGGLARPYTTSSGMPRAGGARPSSKPGKSFGSSAGRGSGPRTGAGSRPSYGAKRTFDGKPAGGFSRPAGGASRPSFRRDEGAGGAPRSPRPYTPRPEGAGSDRPSSKGPYPNSASRADRKSTDTGWKPKTRYGGTGKPASGGYSKPGGSSGYKGKPGGKRPGGAPGGKKRY